MKVRKETQREADEVGRGGGTKTLNEGEEK